MKTSRYTLLILSILLITSAGTAQDRESFTFDGTDLQAFINKIPDNSVVNFPDTEIVYEEVLVINDKRNIIFVFDGFLLSAETTGTQTTPRKNMRRIWPRNRSHILIENCQNIELRGLKIQGPHQGGGVGVNAYVSKLEAQHGIEILNSDSIKMDELEISNIYGDGIYIGKKSNGIIIENSSIHNNGRQGIAITNGENIIIRNNQIFNVRRSHIDLEPNNIRDTVANVVITDNTFGKKRLKWIAAASGKGVVKNITIQDNLMNCPADVRLGNIKNTSRQGPYYFIGNTSTIPYGTKSGEIWRVINVDGLVARDNEIIAQKNRNMHLLRTTNSRDIKLVDNNVPNGNEGIKQ